MDLSGLDVVCDIPIRCSSRHAQDGASRFLSRYLRHSGCLKSGKGWGRRMDGGGWMPWPTICSDCALDRCRGTEGDILAAIRDSDKDRFEIAVMVDDSDVPLWIIAARAVQGHSAPFVLDDRLYWLIKSELSMFLSTLIHGTRRQFLNSILQSGIQPAGAGELGRVHAYYAPFAPDDPRYRAGMRHDSECYIYLHTKSALEDNKMYLTHAGRS